MSSTHFIEFTYVEKLLSFLYHQFLYIRKIYVQIVFGYQNVPHTWSDTKWVEQTIITEQLFLSSIDNTYIREYVRISFLRYVQYEKIRFNLGHQKFNIHCI
jgi:hypothetical protein